MCLFLPSINSVKWNSKFIVGTVHNGQPVLIKNICLKSLPLYTAANC